MLTLVAALEILAIVGLMVLGWFLRGGRTYVDKKAENLATKQDVGAITDAVEKVRREHAAVLENLSQENRMILENLRGRQQLRLVAAERRLQAHQEAYELWYRV